MIYQDCKYFAYEMVNDNDVFDHPSYKTFCMKFGKKSILSIPDRQCERCGAFRKQVQ